MAQEPREAPHFFRPITPGARRQVRCVCGAVFDSAADTDAAAIEEIEPRHRCRRVSLRVKTMDYSEHPLMLKTCPGCGEKYLNCLCGGES